MDCGWFDSSRRNNGSYFGTGHAVTSVAVVTCAVEGTGQVGTGCKGGAWVDVAFVDVSTVGPIAGKIRVSSIACAGERAVSVGTCCKSVTVVGTVGTFIIIGTCSPVTRVA